MKHILVTGANGYIGRCLGKVLKKSDLTTVGTIRSSDINIDIDFDAVISTGSISSTTNWHDVLRDVDCIIHLAARAHAIGSCDVDTLSLFREINRDATINLAKQAMSSRVKRFIYVSSIGVLGDNTKDGAFDNESCFAPTEPYAFSKMEAELALLDITKNSEMELVIVRPPLVYGPAAPGNFQRLLKLVKIGLPLPFGGFHAKKSMISLANLSDFLAYCINSPAAANKTFAVSDGSNWSTAELIQIIAEGMDKKVLLFPFPILLLKLLSRMVNQHSAINKLSSALVVDATQTMKVLGWNPPQSPEDEICEAIEHFVKH